jgi:hypothetical protein
MRWNRLINPFLRIRILTAKIGVESGVYPRYYQFVVNRDISEDILWIDAEASDIARVI